MQRLSQRTKKRQPLCRKPREVLVIVLQDYHYFVLPHDSLSQRLSEPQPTRGSGSPKKWQQITPAMAAGLTDHVWTMEELLSYRVPPDFHDRLDQQAANHTS